MSAFFSYHDASVKAPIWDFKYKLRERALDELAGLMADELIAHLTDSLSDACFQGPAYLIYCPSSSFAAGKKAWDHMEKLSLQIESLINPKFPFLYICTNAVQVRSTDESQHEGTKGQRLKWSTERYGLSPAFQAALRPDIRIICIDDIITTGSTLRAVRQLLTDAGMNRIDSFAFCFTSLLNIGPIT